LLAPTDSKIEEQVRTIHILKGRWGIHADIYALKE